MDFKNILILFTMTILAMTLWFYMGYEAAVTKEQEKFTKTECARYSPITGKFEIIQKD